MPHTILLADDSPTIQKVVAISLAHENYRLVVANDGQEALNQIIETKPDLVLADVIMPERDGYDLCAAIKSNETTTNIPVVLLSGTFENYDDARAQAVGANAHLTKPFEAKTLLLTLREMLPPSNEPADAIQLESTPEFESLELETSRDEMAEHLLTEPAAAAKHLDELAAEPVETASNNEISAPTSERESSTMTDSDEPLFGDHDLSDLGVELLRMPERPASTPAPEPTTASPLADRDASAPPSEAFLSQQHKSSALSKEVQTQIHEKVEKVAWEAFGNLSEQVVQEVVARIEAIAWEVIPQLTEQLVRDEIKLLRESEGLDDQDPA